MQVTAEALAQAGTTAVDIPQLAKRTGTYVGCMFVDHMVLLQRGYGFPSTGAVMTGDPNTDSLKCLQNLPMRDELLAYLAMLGAQSKGNDGFFKTSMPPLSWKSLFCHEDMDLVLIGAFGRDLLLVTLMATGSCGIFEGLYSAC